MITGIIASPTDWLGRINLGVRTIHPLLAGNIRHAWSLLWASNGPYIPAARVVRCNTRKRTARCLFFLLSFTFFVIGKRSIKNKATYEYVPCFPPIVLPTYARKIPPKSPILCPSKVPNYAERSASTAVDTSLHPKSFSRRLVRPKPSLVLLAASFGPQKENKSQAAQS